jgi:hypothetical protein
MAKLQQVNSRYQGLDNDRRGRPREHIKGTSDHACAHPREPRRGHGAFGHYG